MDSVTRAEFGGMFDRTAQEVPMKGCNTPDDINKALKKHQNLLRKARNIHLKEGNKKSARTLMRKIRNIGKLLSSGFGERVIFEAARNPKGIENQTLLHGYKKGKEIILSRHRSEIRVRREEGRKGSRSAKLHRW
jgi:hypothetical protein